MADAFNGNYITLKKNKKLAQYNYNYVDGNFRILEAGTRIKFPYEEFRSLLVATTTATLYTHHYMDEPLFEAIDGSKCYLGCSRGTNGSMTMLVKGEKDGEVIGASSVGLGRYTTTGTNAYNIYNDLWAENTWYCAFRYDNNNNNSSFMVAFDSWWDQERTYNDFTFAAASDFYGYGIVLIYGAITTDGLYAYIQYLIENANWSDYNDDETGEDAHNGGGDGTHEYDPQGVSVPRSDSSVCNPLDTGMIKLYQFSSKLQVKALAQFLWSEDFLSNILQLQADPMSNIIALYSLPFSGASEPYDDNITIGNVGTSVDAKEIKQPYFNRHIGTLKVPKYFGNAFDFVGSCQIYLPFIGFREIQLDIIRGGQLDLTYRWDATNGNVVAYLRCIQEDRFDIDTVAYMFEGNCATQIPLSSSNHASQILALTQTAMAGATGGVVGAASSFLGNADALITPTYKRSGALTTSFGNLGVFDAFIIIDDPESYIPANANKQYGGASNQRAKLNTLSGYQKFRYVRLGDLQYLDNEEKEQLLTILQGGVFI